MGQLARFALLAIALFGAYVGISLSLSHMNTGETCPTLGPLPACYLVAIGYSLVALSTISAVKPWTRNIFFLGWTPVALLAGMGVALELAGRETCPQGAGGIPQCFYSFLMAMICLLLFMAFRKSGAKHLS